MPNTRQAPSHWPLVTEWRAGKGLLCVREGPEASVTQRVGHSVPMRLSQVSGSTTLGLSAGSKPLLSGLRVTLVWQILMTKEVHTHVQVLFNTSIQYLHAGPLCVTQDTETEVTTCRQGYFQASATDMRKGDDHRQFCNIASL